MKSANPCKLFLSGCGSVIDDWDGYRRAMEAGKSRYGEGDVLSVSAVRKDSATISVGFTIVPRPV
jgi:uncharacterized protein YfiM (DUF2279 family)